MYKKRKQKYSNGSDVVDFSSLRLQEDNFAKNLVKKTKIKKDPFSSKITFTQPLAKNKFIDSVSASVTKSKFGPTEYGIQFYKKLGG
tara:strand:- start:881 stop:1141 length:261 start_codon:yes stop_codon:yes gene_type:complete